MKTGEIAIDSQWYVVYSLPELVQSLTGSKLG